MRISLAANPAVTEILLSALAEDAHPDVRYSLAENPAVPYSVLQKLRADENPYIAYRAEKTMERTERSYTPSTFRFQAA